MKERMSIRSFLLRLEVFTIAKTAGNQMINDDIKFDKVRLIDASSYFIENPDQFIGFISGIISQDHDLEKMYFDNFLSISNCGDDFEGVLSKIEKISNLFKVDFVISLSKVESDFSEGWKNCIIVSL